MLGRVLARGRARRTFPRELRAAAVVAEAFFSSLKRELAERRRWPDRNTARRAVFEWLARYNNTRLHTSLGCVILNSTRPATVTPRVTPQPPDRSTEGSA